MDLVPTEQFELIVEIWKTMSFGIDLKSKGDVLREVY